MTSSAEITSAQLSRKSGAPLPSFRTALAVWARIGLLSFGGPTGQIALMHRTIVEERKWVDEDRFLNALSFCMLLPGPEAMQLATYIGWWMHGVRGGLAAGLLFVIPGAFVVLALSVVYALFGTVPAIEALFLGIKAAVLVIVIEALLRISKRALQGWASWAMAAAAFVALFFFGVPYPILVAAAAGIGYVRAAPASADRAPTGDAGHGVPWRQTAATAVLWLAIWLLPLLLIAWIVGPDHVMAQIGYFFSKLAVVTFGGAYAVLAYMGQDVAAQYGWISAGEMMDGLGLAETTPGPLILVTEFVGFLAAYRHAASSPSLVMGIGGAVVTLWATFAPCFLWVFTGAPYVEWLTNQPRLKGALAGVTAAVVGVILNLALWFALHVFFNSVTLHTVGVVRLWTPDPTSLDWRVVLLATISAALLLGRHWNVIAVLAVAALGSLALRLATG